MIPVRNDIHYRYAVHKGWTQSSAQKLLSEPKFLGIVVFDLGYEQGLDYIFCPFQPNVLWFFGIGGKISWNRSEFHLADQKGQKDKVIARNDINRRAKNIGKTSFHCIVLYLLLRSFCCSIIPCCSLLHIYHTHLLICSCGTFITFNIACVCSSCRRHFSDTIVEME